MASQPNFRAALASLIADYRQGEIRPPDADHVGRWINQFPEAVRDPILNELYHVLSKTYFTRANVQTFIDSIVTRGNLIVGNAAQFWQGVKVLDIQTAGSSQKEMRLLLRDALRRHHGLEMDQCGLAPHTYLYLDDALFSGGRIRTDLVNWVARTAPASAKIEVVLIGLHTGYWYTEKEIKKAATGAGKTINLRFWRAAVFEDRLAHIRNSDVLRPVSIPADLATQTYVASLARAPTLRPVGGSSPIGVFSSESGRHLLEQEFLKAGVRVRRMCPNFGPIMRPLGATLFDSLGFGSTIVTYRNCPNNTPLVFWAGDPWYPLFPRKIN